MVGEPWLVVNVDDKVAVDGKVTVGEEEAAYGEAVD